MLSFWKDGKEISIYPLYKTGRVGQTVILGERVDWGKTPDPKKFPLSKYPCPSVFTIVDRNEFVGAGFYILCDSDGNKFTLDCAHSSNYSYLYDAQEWLEFNAMRENEKFSRKERKIQNLEGHIDLLKDILIKQGIRIVTVSQAKKLGLKEE